MASKERKNLMQRSIPDAHWDSSISRKPYMVPSEILDHLKQCDLAVRAEIYKQLVTTLTLLAVHGLTKWLSLTAVAICNHA